MTWERRGLVFAPQGDVWWMRSHAALPAVLPVEDEVIRVFFCSRDVDNRARIGSFDFDPKRPERVDRVTVEPVLDLGSWGAHDDAGVTTGCVVRVGESVQLYYTGWTLGRSVPFYFAVGLALSDDDGQTFERVSEGPVMGRDRHDPYLVASPSVLGGGAGLRAWYVSATGWHRGPDGQPRHRYHIRHAASVDGLDWVRDGVPIIDYADDEEYALGRPHVVGGLDGYEMWFCARGDAYELAYAFSRDGDEWVRDDGRARLVGEVGAWEAEMRCYPHVFDHAGRRYMLYNGNGYGRTGIGLAEYAG